MISKLQRIVPHRSYFDLVVTLKKITNIIFYCVFIISVILPFIHEKYHFLGIEIKGIIEKFNFIGMVLFTGLTFIIDLHLFPNAEKKRRSDFIDNSLGSRFNIEKSKNYFSNDNISIGIYKASVNLFENCFFTLKISEKMRLPQILKSTTFCIIILILAVDGFKESKIATPILQVFLSANVLGELVKLLLFVNRNEQCFNQLITLFNQQDYKNNPLNHLSNIEKCLLDYESNLAWGMILLDSKVFSLENERLSQEWEDIKLKFNI